MKKVYYAGPFDHFLAKFPQFWIFLKDNITILTIIVTIIGSLNQVLTLYLIDPNLIFYFSPSQGILEGVIFTCFAVLLTSLYIFVITLIYFISMRESYSYRIYLFVVISLLLMEIVCLFISIGYGFIGIPLSLPIMLVQVLLLEKKTGAGKMTTPVMSDSRERKINFYLILIYIILIFSVYRYVIENVQNSTSDKILNYSLAEQKVNTAIYPHDFKVIFTNLDHLILESEKTGKYLIVKQNDIDQ